MILRLRIKVCHKKTYPNIFSYIAELVRDGVRDHSAASIRTPGFGGHRDRGVRSVLAQSGSEHRICRAFGWRYCRYVFTTPRGDRTPHNSLICCSFLLIRVRTQTVTNENLNLSCRSDYQQAVSQEP